MTSQDPNDQDKALKTRCVPVLLLNEHGVQIVEAGACEVLREEGQPESLVISDIRRTAQMRGEDGVMTPVVKWGPFQLFMGKTPTSRVAKPRIILPGQRGW